MFLFLKICNILVIWPLGHEKNEINHQSINQSINILVTVTKRRRPLRTRFYRIENSPNDSNPIVPLFNLSHTHVYKFLIKEVQVSGIWK